nr:MAG TPA: tail assembly protein [Caudoviricetes sp.]
MKVMFKKGNEYVILPIVSHINTIGITISDEEFETVDKGPLLLIGKKGLRKFEIESFFPNKIYPFMEIGSLPSPKGYIKFFEKYRDENEPVRVIIISKFKIVLNMECRYNFQYGITDRAGDVPYSLEIMEYKRPQGKEPLTEFEQKVTNKAKELEKQAMDKTKNIAGGNNIWISSLYQQIKNWI